MSLCNCSLTKRQYMKGWHVENWFHKSSHTSANKLTQSVKTTALINTNKSGLQTGTKGDLSDRQTDKTTASLTHDFGKQTSQAIKALPKKLRTLGSNRFFKKGGNSLKKADKGNDQGVFRLIAVYFLFIIGLVSICLIAVSLNNAWGIASLLALFGILTISLAIELSLKFIDKINNHKWLDKKWPYRLIISISIVILSLLISGIIGLVFALLLAQPNLLAVIIITAIAFLICSVICFNLLLPD